MASLLPKARIILVRENSNLKVFLIIKFICTSVISFFSPHFREHSSCWNYSVDFRYCSSKRAFLQTTTALFLGRFFFRSASKILLYIRDRIDICRTEEKSRSNPLEGSVIRRLCLSKNSSFKTHPLKRISFPLIFLPLNRKYAYRLASKSWLTRNYSWDEQQQTGRTSRD